MTAAPPPAAPGDDIVIRGVTWPKLLAMLGTILVAAGAVIYVLLSVVYGGIEERFDSLGKRVQGLDDNFHGVIAAGISVKDLANRAPKLEQTVYDTRSDVGIIKNQAQALQTDMSAIKQQLQTIQQATNQTQISLARMEPIMHRLQEIMFTAPAIGTSVAPAVPTATAAPPKAQ